MGGLLLLLRREQEQGQVLRMWAHEVTKHYVHVAWFYDVTMSSNAAR